MFSGLVKQKLSRVCVCVWHIRSSRARVCVYNRGEVNVDIFAVDEIASGVSPSTELLASPSHKISMSDFKAEVS